MKIAICSGKIDAEIIGGFLRDCLGGKETGIVHYEYGSELLSDFRTVKGCDAVYIDGYLKKMFGKDVAKSLREKGYKGRIFLIGEDCPEATGSLTRPLSKPDIVSSVNIIKNAPEDGIYKMKHYRGAVDVPYGEIIYIESRNSKCILKRTGGREYNIYKKLDDIEKELSNPRFLRCHQSYIVNMDFVSEATDRFLMKNGEVVYIRNRDLKAIKNIYHNFSEK